MYEAYWKLKEKPFENTPDPKFIFWSKEHEEAVSRMLYSIKEKKGAMLISGEYGCGKTLLTRYLLQKLAEDKYQLALVLNPMLSPAQLIKEIIFQLGGTISRSAVKATAFNKLNELLININRNNKLAVIIIDEAQAIPRTASFEEFRLMLNFQLNDRFLLSLILIGQPELVPKISKLPQLEQRLALRYHLKALNEAETKEYIIHRIKVAGGNPNIFAGDSFLEIFNYSLGIPRKINNICDFALLAGSGENVKNINQVLIKKVAADLEGKEY
ncbi:MAG: AAA family ATPase [Candidatus Margulisiibacteriota bacterium]